MTNPGDAIGTNGAFGGRTSPNALNDGLSGYTRGILSGWQCVPKQGMTVALGGDGITRDVAIAEDDTGNHLTVNNRSGQPVDVTIAEAPAVGQRIDVIVAYIQNPPEGTATVVDNPAACGLITVQGTVSNTPAAPTEEEIRTAIGLDGGSGATAYYVVLATISLTEAMTDITATNITGGHKTGGTTVDAALNPLSENPVQNKVITAKITDIEEQIGAVDTALIKLNTGTGVNQ